MRINSVHWTNYDDGQQDNVKFFTVKSDAQKFINKFKELAKNDIDLVMSQDTPDVHHFTNTKELVEILNSLTNGGDPF